MSSRYRLWPFLDNIQMVVRVGEPLVSCLIAKATRIPFFSESALVWNPRCVYTSTRSANLNALSSMISS